MSEAKPLPPTVRAWAGRILGEVTAVRDASHPRDDSRVWELDRGDGRRAFVKVSPSATFYQRETRAYRHAVPAMGPEAAPQLIATNAELLTLLVTGLPSRPLTRQRLAPAVEAAAHRQGARLLARLHTAGEMSGAHREEAEAALPAAADGAEKHLRRAGNRLTAAEQRLVRFSAEEVRRLGPLPWEFIHGDAQLLH